MTQHLLTQRGIFATTTLLLGVLASPGLGGEVFTSSNVDLKHWVTLAELGSVEGNDCWGYVSPSGREYALMGVRTAMVVVEITDPANPVIIDSVAHSDSLWGDMKTYQTYVYVVNESGGGLDIVDLSDVDNGNVTLVTSITTDGFSDSHNVAIDETSGYLYMCGGNLAGGRLQAWDLADPENPVFAGELDSDQGSGVHDAQVVTFTSGPNAGKQIAFSANGGIGLDIYDVTDKGNMFRLSRTQYTGLSYAHQCWLGDDGQYLYLNDETDGVNGTIVFDVNDLSNPFVANIYNSGVSATDHNLFVHGDFVFEAEYQAGVRIFCLTDPVNPVQVGWFDTFPENDDGGFSGAWSCYPYFPSGTLIVSDRTRGLFVLDPSAALTDCADDVLGDLDGDGIVGINDFLMLLAEWGPCDGPCPPSCVADLDDDCTVGITDFLLLLANWT